MLFSYLSYNNINETKGKMSNLAGFSREASFFFGGLMTESSRPLSATLRNVPPCNSLTKFKNWRMSQ